MARLLNMKLGNLKLDDNPTKQSNYQISTLAQPSSRNTFAARTRFELEFDRHGHSRITTKTPVAILQDFLLRYGITPTYEEMYVTGPLHCRTFACKVSYEGKSAMGEGTSKQEAKHAAAQALIDQICNQDAEVTQSTLKSTFSEDWRIGNPIGWLQELCMHANWSPPSYKSRQEGMPHTPKFTCECSMLQHKEWGVGRTRKDAKHNAASKMCERVNGKLPRVTKPNQLTQNDITEAVRAFREFKDTQLASPGQEEDGKKDSTTLSFDCKVDMGSPLNPFDASSTSDEEATGAKSPRGQQNHQRALVAGTGVNIPIRAARRMHREYQCDSSGMCNIYVTGLAPDTTEDELMHYMRSKGCNFPKFDQIPPKPAASYRIIIPQNQKDNFLQSTTWPRGVSVGEWIPPKPSPTQPAQRRKENNKKRNRKKK